MLYTHFFTVPKPTFYIGKGTQTRHFCSAEAPVAPTATWVRRLERQEFGWGISWGGFHQRNRWMYIYEFMNVYENISCDDFSGIFCMFVSSWQLNHELNRDFSGEFSREFMMSPQGSLFCQHTHTRGHRSTRIVFRLEHLAITRLEWEGENGWKR